MKVYGYLGIFIGAFFHDLLFIQFTKYFLSIKKN